MAQAMGSRRNVNAAPEGRNIIALCFQSSAAPRLV
jgi:hypothetical protein